MIRSEKRSASAAIVNGGFGPIGPGITEPSATNSPGRPKTSPQVSTTPSAGFFAIAQPRADGSS